jgi:6-phosphogluconolactonase
MEELSNVRVFADAGELARASAGEMAQAIEAALAARDRCAVALSGGSTPRATFRLLASSPLRDRLAWDRIHFFWVDERHVPHDHSESNFRMAREAMLDIVPVPPGNVHRMRAENPDAAEAAAQYESELRSFFGRGEWPRFDFIQLGLGPDGHTASLFPGNPEVFESERWVVAPWVPAHHTFRITLTPPVLNHAARLLFLVSGEDKAHAVREVIAGERAPERYPGQVIEPVEGTLVWMVDRSAARLLESAG